jgi:VanZ family protein
MLFFGWILVIFTLSSVPQATLSRWNPGIAAAWGHFLEYGLLGVFWYRWRNTGGTLRATVWLAGLALAALIAGLDELYQSFVPGRATEWRDGLVDLVGFLIGAMTTAWISRKLSALRKNPVKFEG